MPRKNQDPVLPPAESRRHTGMHWLEIRDYDGHSHGTIALQWNGSSQTWCHSGSEAQHDTKYFDTTGWDYIGPIKLPPMPFPGDHLAHAHDLLEEAAQIMSQHAPSDVTAGTDLTAICQRLKDHIKSMS